MKHTWKRLAAVLLAAVMTLGLLPAAALAAGGTERAVTLPAGNRWAYVSNSDRQWGVGTEAHALKLYKLTDSSAVSGSAATAIEDGGIYLIGDTAPAGSSDKYRKMYAQAGATDSCGESTVPGDPYTLPSGCQSHKTNHMFRLSADGDGWYTIQSVSNNKYLDISSCTVGTYNQIALTTTPTKFAVVKSGSDAGMFTIAAAVVDPDAPPDLSELTEPLYGAIVDDDLQYVRANFNAALAADAKAAALNAWRNDTAVSQILLATGKNAQTRVTAAAGDFSDGEGHTIAAQNVDLSFIKVVQAYTGMPGYATVPARPVPTGSRKDAAEVLMGNDPVDMDAGTVQGLWVSVNVPKDAAAGTYTGTVTVTADGVAQDKELTFTYTLNVASPVLPDATEFKDGFDIELWQNPYASAEYYGVEPFSAEHFAILRPIMEKYKSVGGHAVTATIVDEAWNGQTYSANDVHYPGMVKWTKKADGTWEFNYDQFDAWVDFCKNVIGIGDKIICYSIAPWSCAISYYDEASAQQQRITIARPADHSEEWDAAWTACLTALKDHLTAKGWTDGVYIGFDERGFSTGAFDIVDSVKGSDGKRFFRIAGAMDGFVNQRELAMRTDVLSIGSVAVKDHLTEYRSLLADRNAAGKTTTVYTCTGHIPGSFSLSAPGESYWTMLYAYSVGGTGYLRWAYDSWVANPLQDTTHCNFEAGDCFLVFPDEKNAENPVVHSSLRLEKMAQGVRDVNKLMTIQKNCPAMDTAVNALLATVKANYDNTKGSGSWGYLTDAGKTALAADMKTLRQGIVTLTAEYEERLALGATKKVNLQPKDVPIVMLPEQYQGDVYGPILDRSKQYYGQPDMITLPDGTLVTVFPQGHGHGPLIMMKSDNRGENWEEIETPASWADSLETPTMYRLSFTDGSVRYIMITARPSWSGSNSIYGWDASISDDGIHWSESQRFHSENYETIVAMASLVQLKDKSGNFIDKWMGVFHDGSFRNLKTYLTFDAQGNMQWSRPEPYLAEYRSIESAKQICEVGMFRSPDGNRIVAMGRTQSHNCLSVIFWSDDEGETWTKPMDMQGALYGERHKALYDPISGRLVITFREMICTGENSNGGFGGWTCGEWMAWVGTYEDLMEFNEGQYRIRLDEDWAPSAASGDTGYTGMAVYPDGTFVLDTYGHWDKEFSTTQGYDPKTDRCWIRRAKFKLSDIDALYKTRLETEVPTEELSSAVLAKNAKANSWYAVSHATDGGAAWAFDDSNHWWHSNYGTATADNLQGHPSVETPIWIQTGFDEKREITAVSYRGRTDRTSCVINDYELQFACLEDPTAQPADADFETVKSGTFQNSNTVQTITLDQPVEATHVRLVTTRVYGNDNVNTNYAVAQRIRVYAVGEAAYRSDAAQLTSLTVGDQSVAVRGADLGAVAVDAGASSVTLATAYSAKAKLNILVNGRPIAKDAPISLAGDVTQVKLRVVAEDGVTTSVYDLAIVKEKEDNAQLRQLSLGTLKLYPAFDPAVTEYYAVAYGNRTAGLTAVAAQPGATLAYEAVADAGTGTGTVSGATCRFFKSGSESAAGGKLYYTEDGRLYNTVTVTVTAPDGSGSTPYTIHVEVRESAYLSDLGWSAIVGNVPIRDRAWSYNDLSLIGENGSEITFDTPKGLGVRANTVVEYNLSDWGFDTLSGRVGVSYAQRASANVPELQFRVILDGQEAMMQSSTKDAAAPDTFTVDLGAANKLALRTTAVGGSVTDADGNWTDLRLSTIIPLLENLDSKPITALEFAEHETHTIYANEGDDDSTVTLRPAVTPVDSPELLLWESDDTAVATVNDGVVTAVAPGTATITVRASGSPETIFATCTVTVKQKLMGSVTVSGANEGVAKYGATLTADLNTFAQEAKDHLDIQWYRGETAIPGAKEQNYVVQAEDIEETLKVVITGKDPYEGTSASRVLSVTKADGLRMQATPTHRNVSGEGAEDGAITGLFEGRAYEYQTWTLDGTMPALTDPWTPVEWPDGTVEEVPGAGDTYGTGEISGLGVGNYRVRRAETDTHFAGEPSATVSIVVPGGAEVELVVPQNVEGGTVRANRDQIPVGDTVTLWVTVDEGYQFKSLTVTDASSNDIPVSPGTEDGVYTFLMPATRATVAVEFERKTYTITHALEHIDCNMAEHEHQAAHGEELTILLTPHAGYEMPRSLTVTNTDTGAAFTDYTYLPDSPNSPNRELHFTHGVTGNLTVEGEGVLKRYTVVYHLTDGLRAANAPQTATHATDFTASLSAAGGYALPNSITVEVNGTELEQEQYDYNAESGKIDIPGERVTGNVVITAAGEAKALTLQTISLIGPAREGRTLTVKTVPVNATVEYQWIMVDENGDETEIEDATQQEYFIPADAVGKKIKVRVKGTGSYAGELTSEPTATILREAEPFVFVDSVRVQANAEVNVGRTVKLSATAEPSNATSPILFWSSSNEAIATVDQNGVVKGVAEGTVTITVASTDRLANRTATCRVTVTKPASPSRPSGTTTPSETTTTETRDDGTKVTTVTKPDGSKTQTVEQPDGTKSELAVTKDGDVTITVTNPEGEEIVKAEIPATIPETETRFDDVPVGHWADKAIHNAAGLKLVEGVGNNKYDPVTPMTRGSLATVLHRLSQGKTDYEVTFRDVAETKFYAPGVAWAAKAGVVTGYTADIFAPEDIITREQLAVMLARYAKLIGMNTKADAKALDKFNDGENTGSWAVDGMAWCVENGIIQGKDGNRLDPTTDVSRAEVAMMLDRFIALLK